MHTGIQDLSATEPVDGLEQALAVNHGENMDGVVLNLVDQAVAVEETLAYVGVREFRHDAPDPGVRRLFVGKIEQAFDDLLCVVAGVSANVLSDAINVIERLIRPTRG